MLRRRGRPPHPDPVTPGEQRVLDLVREGKNNAEIAVRLGISINTVRFHVSHLLNKAGATSRDELHNWQPGSGRRWNFVPGLPGLAGLKPLLFGAGCVAAVGAMALGIAATRGGDSRPDSDFDAERIPTADELLARGLVDAGPLLLGPDPVASVDERGLFSVVALNEGARISLGTPRSPWERTIGGGSSGPHPVDLGAVGSVAGRLYTLNVAAYHLAELTFLSFSEMSVEPGEDGAPALFVEVRDHQSGTPRAATFDSGGHLFIDPRPLADGAVFDMLTGRPLETSSVRLVGPLVDTQRLVTVPSSCSGGACAPHVWGIRSQQLVAPLAGVLRCANDQDLVLDSGELRFRIDMVGEIGWCATAARTLAAGDPLGISNVSRVVVLDEMGRQLNAGVDSGGYLLVSVGAPSPACPCKPFGN
ncbi:MAG: helix-turn-helix transcriptional regulator [Dehalococcoidia bacterium]